MTGATDSFRPENLVGDDSCDQQDGRIIRKLNERACPGGGWIWLPPKPLIFP